MKLPIGFKGKQLKASWVYRCEKGETLGFVGRYDGNNGKDIVPFFKRDDSKIVSGIGNVDRPLLFLNNIACSTSDAIHIFEGEKVASAASQFGLLSTTSIGGSSAAAKTDWRPISRFNKVVIWPDNDECGMKCASDVRDILIQQNPEAVITFVILDVGGGGDLVDWLQGRIKWDGYNEIDQLSIQRLKPELMTVIEKATNFDFDWQKIIETGPLPSGENMDKLMPERFARVIRELSRFTETPFDFCAAMGLGIYSSLAQRGMTIEVKKGYLETPNLFVCAAMESGNRKSAVVRYLGRPILEIEKEMVDESKKKIAEAIKKNKLVDDKIAEISKRNSAKSGDVFSCLSELRKLEDMKVMVPSIPQLITNDATPESVAKLLKENRGRIGIISDEGGIFDILEGRYSQNGKVNLDVFLQGFCGDSVRVNRNNAAPVIINDARVALAISPQPSVLSSLCNNSTFRNRGFVARFLFLLPESKLGYRSFDQQPIPEEVEEDYATMINDLLNLSGVKLSLSDEAFQIYLQVSRANEIEMRDGEKCEFMKDWASKYPAQIVRIAGLFHLIERSTPIDLIIGADTFRKAVGFGEHLKHHAVKILSNPSVIADENLARIFRKIKNEQSRFITEREIHRTVKNHVKDKREVSAIIEKAVNSRFLRKLTSQHVPNRKSVVYESHPQLITGDNFSNIDFAFTADQEKCV